MGLCLKLRYCSQYSYVLLIIFRFIMLLYLIKPKRKYYDGKPFSKQMVLFVQQEIQTDAQEALTLNNNYLSSIDSAVLFTFL